ncbi:MAG: NAD(P)H-dependent glycerol-3-phosphate dehydrogenase [Bacteroidota bacterium]
MSSNTSSPETVGVIGAGSFGSALANLLAENQQVLLYARRPAVAKALQHNRSYKGRNIADPVRLTNDLQELAKECELIFPIVPSENFRGMIRSLAPYLNPSHKLIHGTKGFDIQLPEGESLDSFDGLNRDHVKTMSEVIREETVVLRVGCVAGPNLAGEIADGQPAATVVGSRFDEVIRSGQLALRSSRFRVHGNHELLGIELAGVLKNIMAVAAGVLAGMELGDNTRAMLITRGLAEMVYIGKGLGANVKPFLGLAGIGDLVATCSSPHSRNFNLGYRLGKGESLTQIRETMEETAEGVKTIQIVRALSSRLKISAPISLALHRILFEGMEIEKGMRLLMEFPFREDVEFI